MAEPEFDLLIIGTGPTGYGTFLTATTCGLKTALVDKGLVGHDGANNATMKMIQPGSKYVKTNLAMVRDDAVDCGLLKTISGGLLRRQTFVLPIYKSYKFPLNEPLIMGAYFDVYDRFSKLALHPPHKMLGAEEVKKLEPSLAGDVWGGVLFYEWIADPLKLARACVDLGEQFGGVVMENSRVTGFRTEKTARGLLVRSAIIQGQSGVITEARARYFANAAGAWAPRVINLITPEHSLKLRPTKGTSIVVNKRLTNNAVVLFGSGDEYVALLPEGETTLIGPTNFDISAEVADNPDLLKPEFFEVEYLRLTANQHLNSDFLIDKNEIIKKRCGLRPQLPHEGVQPYDVTHQFGIFDHETDGIINLASGVGGKLSLWVRMSKEFTELICAKINFPFEWRTPYVRLDGNCPAVRAPLLSSVHPCSYPLDSYKKRRGLGSDHELERAVYMTALRKRIGATATLARHILRSLNQKPDSGRKEA